MIKPTYIVKRILIINIIVFIMQMLLPVVNEYVMLYPYLSDNFQYYQYVTACFAHGGLIHLAFNMVALVSFGSIIEKKYGALKFTKFYLTVGILANILWHILSNPTMPALGASGALFGILTLYVIKYPNTKLFIIFLPMVSFKASSMFLAVIVFEILGSLFLNVGIGHSVHLLGAGLGLFYYIIFMKGRDNLTQKIKFNR